MKPNASVEDRIARHLAALIPQERFGVAVSGGGDSVALLHLAKDWADANGVEMVALTVDHGLRPESREEAEWVAVQCAGRGIPHDILNWHSDPSERGNLSAAARNGRYELMSARCSALGVATLLTGHTEDDQAETFLLRLARGSGVDGLAGIPESVELHGVTVMRPMLDIAREELRAWLRGRGMGWKDDPTNDDASYDRVKARQALGVLEELGVRPARLAKTAAMMREAQTVLDDAARELLQVAVTPSPLGYFRLDRAHFAASRRDTLLRLLSRLMGQLSGAIYRPRRDSLEVFAEALTAGPSAGGSALQGCRLVLENDTALLIREAAACPALRPLSEHPQIWDARFAVELTPDRSCFADMMLGALGEKGWAQIARRGEDGMEKLRTAPYPARLAIPVVWHENEVVAVPSLKMKFADFSGSCVIAPLPTFSGAGVDPEPDTVM